MNRISSEDEVLRLINDNEMVVVYFTGRDCGACEAIKFKIEGILRTLPNIKAVEIDGEKNVELAAKYGVPWQGRAPPTEPLAHKLLCRLCLPDTFDIIQRE